MGKWENITMSSGYLPTTLGYNGLYLEPCYCFEHMSTVPIAFNMSMGPPNIIIFWHNMLHDITGAMPKNPAYGRH